MSVSCIYVIKNSSKNSLMITESVRLFIIIIIINGLTDSSELENDGGRWQFSENKYTTVYRPTTNWH